jgi:opacity protein-like surface antigen
MKASIKAATFVGVFSAIAAPAGAQAFYAGVRAGAGMPTGTFAEKSTATGNDAQFRNATPGLGYGLDAGVGSTLLGLYGSYDRMQFGCASGACSTSGKYELNGYAAGVRASVPLLPLIKPWAKAGITYNEMKQKLSASSSAPSVSTGKKPGYEVGAGVDIPILMGFFSLSPQVRYIRQKFSGKSADYYTFDIGLKLRSPL